MSIRKEYTPVLISSATLITMPRMRVFVPHMSILGSPGDRAHSVATFETVDRGLIFIEPQYNDEVKLCHGISYAEENRHTKPDYDDTITRLSVEW